VKKRIDRNAELGKIYVQWNIKEIDGDTAMGKIHELYKAECKVAWFRYGIRKEMTVK
jgi:hypothetical protein